MQGYPPGGGYGPPPQPPGYGPPGYGPPRYGPPGQFAPPPAYGYAPAGPQYAPYGFHPTLGVPYSDKQKVLAGILQIFLGKFGIGRFYTGHTNLAIAQLVTCMIGVWVLSWFTCGLSIFVLLWPVIDGIVILATDSLDANGYALR